MKTTAVYCGARGVKGDSEIYNNNNCRAVLGVGIPPQQAALSLRTLSVGPEMGHVTSLENLYMTNQVKCNFETDLKPEVDMELKNRK